MNIASWRNFEILEECQLNINSGLHLSSVLQQKLIKIHDPAESRFSQRDKMYSEGEIVAVTDMKI